MNKEFIVHVKFGEDARAALVESVPVVVPIGTAEEIILQTAIKLIDGRLDLGHRVFAASVKL